MEPTEEKKREDELPPGIRVSRDKVIKKTYPPEVTHLTKTCGVCGRVIGGGESVRNVVVAETCGRGTRAAYRNYHFCAGACSEKGMAATVAAEWERAEKKT